MTFLAKLQHLCDEEGVDLVPNIMADDGAYAARMTAYKGGRHYDIDRITAKRTPKPTEEPATKPMFGSKRNVKYE